MVSRVYVEKKPEFDVESKQLEAELRTLLGIEGLESLRTIRRYDVEGIDDELFEQCVPTVFSEPQVDMAHRRLPTLTDDSVLFAVEYLPVSLTNEQIRRASAFSSSRVASAPKCVARRCTCSRAI